MTLWKFITIVIMNFNGFDIVNRINIVLIGEGLAPPAVFNF